MNEIAKQRSRRAMRALDRLTRNLEPRLASAFLVAVRQMRNRVSIARVERLVRQGDLTGAITLVTEGGDLGQAMRGRGIEPGTRTVEDILLESFRQGGQMGAEQLPRNAALEASLDLTNPESIAFLSERLPDLIRQVSDEQKNSVRLAVLRGFEEGRPIPEIARDVRGNIGLTESQAAAVRSFRLQLATGRIGEASAPWDRRLSGPEKQQARSLFRSTSPDPRKVDAIVNRYRESLVNRRALNIARTEVHRAAIAGQQELWRQAAERGLIEGTRTRRVWITSNDERLRASHAAVPGMNPNGVGINEPFQTPVGPVMRPGEGPASFAINCFLPGTKVRGRFVAGLKAWYSGDVVEIQTARGSRLTVTANHPILTTLGWKPAHSLSKQEDLITDRVGVHVPVNSRQVDKQNEPATVEEVFESLGSPITTVRAASLDLHGDEVFLQNDVRKVGANWELEDGFFTGSVQQIANLLFIATYITKRLIIGTSPLQSRLNRVLLSSALIPGGRTLFMDLVRSHLTPFQPLGFGSSANINTLFKQYSRDRLAANPELVGELLDRGTGLVTTDQIINIVRYPFSGHVYDLQEVNGTIIAQNIVSSNCRCAEGLRFDSD